MAALDKAGVEAIKYGMFIKAYNRFKEPAVAKASTTKVCSECAERVFRLRLKNADTAEIRTFNVYFIKIRQCLVFMILNKPITLISNTISPTPSKYSVS